MVHTNVDLPRNHDMIRTPNLRSLARAVAPCLLPAMVAIFDEGIEREEEP